MTDRMPPADRREFVFLLHGLGRTSGSMRRLQRRLEAAGFAVRPWGYRSFRQSIADHADRLRADLQAIRTGPVHFVTHSMGGIIVRAALCPHPPPHVGRVVMLAPPNHGSAVARVLAPALGWFIRPLADLSDQEGSFVRTLGTPDGVCAGIIAAARDGKVRLGDTHLPGEADHVIVPGFHTFIMHRSDVADYVIRFLRTGAFSPRFARPATESIFPAVPS